MKIKLNEEKLKEYAVQGNNLAQMFLDYETKEVEIKESKQKGIYIIPGATAVIQGEKKSLDQYLDGLLS